MRLLLLGLLCVAPVLAESGDELAARERTIEMELRRHPESREARLSLAKLLHFRAVDGDAKAASQSTELLERLASEQSDDPVVLARLGSVGQPVPGVDVEIRDGEIYVRGEQIAGEYLEAGAPADGWFATRDRGWLDDDGYLFVG